MQANGAEILRLACCYMTEAGIRVCAPDLLFDNKNAVASKTKIPINPINLSNIVYINY